MKFSDYRAIHFLGIGGIGVSALARLAKLMGKAVSGSDMRESVVTQALITLGVDVKIGHDKVNVPPGTDLVVHTEDVNESSAGFAELSAAKAGGIRTLKYSEALGLLVGDYYGVGVSGTNGKSTSTAILGLIIQQAGLDPMVVLGSRLAPANETAAFQGNARFGEGRHFIYEADEYHRHMLDSHPKAVLLTNVEADHLDYYKDLADVKSAFAEFIRQLPDDGLLVYNRDDADTKDLATANGTCRKATFGMQEGCDYMAHQAEVQNQVQSFSVLAKGRDLGRFSLAIPGGYNLMNALGALAMALELGVEAEAARTSLSEFKGIWRRFEKVGEYMGKPVISDYAHHPTALTGLIKAAAEFYPGQRILLVFQPHQKNRTKMLFNDFVESLKSAPELILTEIYSVPGREKGEDQDISSRDIVKALAAAGKQAEYAADLDQADDLIRAKASNADVILLAGAGTIDQLARKLIAGQ